MKITKFYICDDTMKLNLLAEHFPLIIFQPSLWELRQKKKRSMKMPILVRFNWNFLNIIAIIWCAMRGVWLWESCRDKNFINLTNIIDFIWQEKLSNLECLPRKVSPVLNINESPRDKLKLGVRHQKQLKFQLIEFQLNLQSSMVVSIKVSLFHFTLIEFLTFLSTLFFCFSF